jgi:hypothetical protein
MVICRSIDTYVSPEVITIRTVPLLGRTVGVMYVPSTSYVKLPLDDNVQDFPGWQELQSAAAIEASQRPHPAQLVTEASTLTLPALETMQS